MAFYYKMQTFKAKLYMNYHTQFVRDSGLYLQVITPFRNLVLCADSRREMEEWISALKTAAKKEFYDVS